MASSATLAIPPLVWSLGTTALIAASMATPPWPASSNLVVPAIALAVSGGVDRAIHSRAVRHAMQAPHILAARARGIGSTHFWLHGRARRWVRR